MDDTELTYKFWRIRKTVMQVRFKYKVRLEASDPWCLTCFYGHVQCNQIKHVDYCMERLKVTTNKRVS